MKSFKPEDIVLGLTSLGYNAKHVTGISDHEKSGGKERNHIQIETGRRVDAILYLNEDVPTFRTFGKYTEEKTGLSGDELKKYNTKQAMQVKAKLTGPVIAALVAADAEGVNLAALNKGFGLKAPSGNAPGQELDDDTPDQSAQRPSFKQPRTAPAQTA